MAGNKLTCPECQAVLKLANPPTPGKRIKCSKCGSSFAVPADKEKAPAGAAKPAKAGPKGDPAKSAIKAKKPAGGPAKSGGKSSGAAPAPAKTEEKKPEEDTTYGVLDKPEAEEEEDDKKKKKKKSVFDPVETGPRNPRGPAAAIVVRPSNFLLADGVKGCFGWLATIVLVLWPIVFPPIQDEKTKEARKKLEEGVLIYDGVASVSRDDPNALVVDPPLDPRVAEAAKDMAKEAATRTLIGAFTAVGTGIVVFIVLLLLLPLILGFAYSATVAYGAVKMQSLESKVFGYIASIMAMIPIHSFGFFLFVNAVMWRIGIELLEDYTLSMYLFGFYSLVIFLGPVLVGIWCITTLMNPDVIAGFNYRRK